MKVIGFMAVAILASTTNAVHIEAPSEDDYVRAYNFERDVTAARAMDTNFDNRVVNIREYNRNYRKTYRDPDYLRDPITPYESALRKMEDGRKAEFEAVKQALDAQKTKFEIAQAEDVARRAGAAF